MLSSPSALFHTDTCVLPRVCLSAGQGTGQWGAPAGGQGQGFGAQGQWGAQQQQFGAAQVLPPVLVL